MTDGQNYDSQDRASIGASRGNNKHKRMRLFYDIQWKRIRGIPFIMAALCNRAGHYIFALWFLSFFPSFFLFFSPNLSGRRLDVYHTSTHGVALVRI